MTASSSWNFRNASVFFFPFRFLPLQRVTVPVMMSREQQDQIGVWILHGWAGPLKGQGAPPLTSVHHNSNSCLREITNYSSSRYRVPPPQSKLSILNPWLMKAYDMLIFWWPPGRQWYQSPNMTVLCWVHTVFRKVDVNPQNSSLI